MLQYNAQSINKPHNFAQKLREIEHFLWAWLTKRPIQQKSKDICTVNVFGKKINTLKGNHGILKIQGAPVWHDFRK